MKRSLTPRQWGKVKATTTLIRGYRASESEVFCLTCLCKDESIFYDDKQPVTKQMAYKENLICNKCGQPLCPPKHSKFLDRITNAKRAKKD